MFTNKILWSHFHLHSVSLIESVDTELLHGVPLVSYQILITCHQQVTVYHGLDTKVKANPYAIFMHVLILFWNLLLATKVIANLSMPMSILVTRLLSVIVFSMAYVMGDGLSSDKMCGHFLGYSQVNWLSRVCNISFANSDNLQYNCEHISMYYLQQKSNKALKLFGLKEFQVDDTIPPENMVKKLQQGWNQSYHVCHIICITQHSVKFGLEAILMELLLQHQQILCMHIVMVYSFMLSK